MFLIFSGYCQGHGGNFQCGRQGSGSQMLEFLTRSQDMTLVSSSQTILGLADQIAHCRNCGAPERRLEVRPMRISAFRSQEKESNTEKRSRVLSRDLVYHNASAWWRLSIRYLRLMPLWLYIGTLKNKSIR